VEYIANMPERLRIAMISLHTSPVDSPGAGDAGGMNVVEFHEAEALAALGHEVDLITRRSDPAQPDAVTLEPGVTLRHLTAGPPERLAKSAIDQHIREFRSALSGLGGYDLIHSHHWMSGAAALPVARAWGVPHVQSYHSVAARPGSALSEGEPPESPDRVTTEALLARESDLVVAISAAEARTVIERCGADPDRVAIVPWSGWPPSMTKLSSPEPAVNSGDDRASATRLIVSRVRFWLPLSIRTMADWLVDRRPASWAWVSPRWRRASRMSEPRDSGEMATDSDAIS